MQNSLGEGLSRLSEDGVVQGHQRLRGHIGHSSFGRAHGSGRCIEQFQSGMQRHAPPIGVQAAAVAVGPEAGSPFSG